MGTLNLTAKQGNTFYAVPIQILINGVPLDLTNATILIQLRKDAGTPIIFEPTTTIINAVNADFKIDEQIFDIQACLYKFDIRIVTGSGQIHNWAAGFINVQSVISKPN